MACYNKKILLITSLAPKALQAISHAVGIYCNSNNVSLLATSPSTFYLRYKIGFLKSRRLKPLPVVATLIKYVPFRYLLTSSLVYLLQGKHFIKSLEAHQAVLDSVTRSKLAFRLFIFNKDLALKIFSEYYKFRKIYSKIFLDSQSIDYLFVYHSSYIVWYAFIDAAFELQIPVVVASPIRAAFKVDNLPLASNNPISYTLKKLSSENNYVGNITIESKLPWVRKSIADDLGINSNSSYTLSIPERQFVILAHVVSDSKYALSNTSLYDTYFEWTIDTVKAYIRNRVDYPLVIRFHPNACHPSHEWSFHLLMKNLKKIKNFNDYIDIRKIILDLPWTSSDRNPTYSSNDVFVTYQGTAVLDLAISGVKSISMNLLHMNNNITYVPPSIEFYTSSLITNCFISSYCSALSKTFQMQARQIYSEYAKLTISSC